MKKLNVSIVTYHHSEKFLERVLSSVFKNQEVLHELMIVDHSSTDALRTLEKNYPLRYIHPGTNNGFGAGHNIALKRSLEEKVPYHLVLNPDMEFGEGIFSKLTKYMDEHHEAVAIMPKIVYPDGRLQEVARLIPSSVDMIARRFLPPLAKLMKSSFSLPENRPGIVPILSGCFLFLRVSALERVGLFDDRYFMYMEDVDLCRRMSEVGENIYFPEVSVIHDFQKASYKDKKFLKFHVNSAIRYFNKWGWIFDHRRRRINSKAKENSKT